MTYLDKLGSLADYKAPWQTESGEDAEIDKGKLRTMLYNIKEKGAKALDAKDEALEKLKVTEAERDTAKAEVAKASPEESNKKIAKLEAENADLKGKVTGLEKAQEVSDLRAEVLAGVDPKHAKHVHGETKEELEKSWKEVQEDFGITAKKGDPDNDGDRALFTQPRTLLNPADVKPGDDTDTGFDAEKVAAGILGRPFG